MDTYIQNLANNYIIPTKPVDIDLVLDGGAFNGFYQLGSLKLIKELENRNYLKVNRISGVSVGAILGFYYISNQLDKFEKDFEITRDYFRENLNVGLYRKNIKDRINKISQNIFQKIQSKLFISYYNIQDGKRVVTNKYDSKNNLTNCILKSSHLPYISNGELFYKDVSGTMFIDGLYPYIFRERDHNTNTKILYISLTNFHSTGTLLSTKREVNVSGRIIEGALDAHKLLFLNKDTVFCSFIQNWNSTDFIFLRIKHVLFIFIIYTIIVFKKFHDFFITHCVPYVYYLYNNNSKFKKITDFLLDTFQYNQILGMIDGITKNIFKDFMLYYCI
jgi:hypothetical protein